MLQNKDRAAENQRKVLEAVKQGQKIYPSGVSVSTIARVAGLSESEVTAAFLFLLDAGFLCYPRHDVQELVLTSK